MTFHLIGVCWLLTTKCNLNCPMCYRFQGDRSRLDLSSKRRVFQRLIRENVHKVTFAGGEPLLDADLPMLVRLLSRQGVKTALCTNGELLSDSLLELLSTDLSELTVAIDGSTEEIHGAMRSSPGNLGVSLRILEKIGKTPIRMDVSTVVTRVNYDDLENIRALVLRSGISKWKVFQFYPLENGAKNRGALELSFDDFAKLRAQLAHPKLEIDFRDAREDTIRSYLHISPAGRMLIVEGADYRDVGSFLDCVDIQECLETCGFQFEIHRKRHWCD